jgi:hypothetical protein
MGSHAHVARAKTDTQIPRHKQRRVSKCDKNTKAVHDTAKASCYEQVLSNISRHGKEQLHCDPDDQLPGWLGAMEDRQGCKRGDSA